MSVQIFTSIHMLLLLTYFSLDKNGGPTDVTITGVIMARLKTTCRFVFLRWTVRCCEPRKNNGVQLFPHSFKQYYIFYIKILSTYLFSILSLFQMVVNNWLCGALRQVIVVYFH